MPYLKQLGVSHVYASPLLKAREGSVHGYDTIDHSQLNPELGTYEDFITFSDALKEHDLGLIVDIVPNHMAIGSSNAWWMDVLENGQASPYARYFDIDWDPVKEELRGKVLLPVLGDHYGDIVERGELKLAFSPGQGLFQVHYWSHRFPISPVTYPLILRHRLDVLKARFGNNSLVVDEYLSISNALERLPSYQGANHERLDERSREKRINLRRLAHLCEQEPELVSFLQESLNDINEGVGDGINRHRLHRLLEGQAYRLAYWRTAQDEINYRRFFDVNELAGLRQEDAQVFRDTHRLIIDLVAENRIQGLRIDHPDGLFQPTHYFRKLQEEAARAKGWPNWDWQQANNDRPLGSDRLPLYVLGEKILAPYEKLPDTWMLHGTTGYEFCNSALGVLVNHELESEMTKTYERFTGWRQSFDDLSHECKLLIMSTALASELTVLAHQLNKISETRLKYRDLTYNKLWRALAEVVACFPVYRTYAEGQKGRAQVRPRAKEYIHQAIREAKKRSRAFEHSVFDFIQDCLTLTFEADASTSYRKQVLAFVQKFQQYTGPLMAKGLEDTAFYRYNRLVALNEVGAEPHHYGHSVEAFHQANANRLKRTPFTMLATSTHDTKRSEDVRLRIAALSEMPDRWAKELARWSETNRFLKTDVDGQLAPDRNDEYLLYQTLVGIWPDGEPNQAQLEKLTARLQEYMLKAMREAKVHTSWINQNEAYEQATTHFVEGMLKEPTFLTVFQPFAKDVAEAGQLNSLSQVLLKFTCPGIPDIYQGNETLDDSLVDPDNRRKVDYPELQQALAIVARPPSKAHWQSLWQQPDIAQIKLYWTHQLLQLKQRLPNLFWHGSYEPLTLTGEQAKHWIGFIRRFEDESLLVLAPRCMAWLLGGQSLSAIKPSLWADTAITDWPSDLPRDRWKSLLSGAIDGQLPLSLSELLVDAPMLVAYRSKE